MEIHFKTYIIDGLNMDDSIYNWKNKLLLANIGEKDQNIANAHVVISGPLVMPKEGPITIENWKLVFKDEDEALRIISLFLACYDLATDNWMPIITKSSSGGLGLTVKESESLDKYAKSGTIPLTKSTVPKKSIQNTMESLEKTTPLFDKVMKIAGITKSSKENPLTIALVVYQRGMESREDLKSFIDFVTVLEALFSDGRGELRYKFALRTTLFTETDETKRRELFDFLKNVYDIRSDLLHGTDISMGAFSDLTIQKYRLKPVIKKALLNYIELTSQNKTKEDILKHVDNLALGISN